MSKPYNDLLTAASSVLGAGKMEPRRSDVVAERRVAITVDGLDRFPAAGTPVRCGLPLEKGQVKDLSRVCLLDEAGKPVSAQAWATGYWQDGSIKWLALEFMATGKRYTAAIGGTAPPHPVRPIQAWEDEQSVTIVTGPMKLMVAKNGFAFPGAVWIDRDGDGIFAEAEKITDGGRMFVKVRGEPSGTYVACAERVQLEMAGPLRATVRLAGTYAGEEGSIDRWEMRIHAYAGSDCLVVQHSFQNELDVRNTETMAVGLEFPVAALRGAKVSFGVDGGTVLAGADGASVSAVQTSAVRPAFPRFDQFDPVCTVTAGDMAVGKGARSDGWMTAEAGGRAIGVGLRDLWQKWPGGLGVDGTDGTVRVMIVPETGQPYDWYAGRDPKMIAPSGSQWGSFGQLGLGFTDEFLLSFGADAATAHALTEAFCAIPNALADPKWLEQTLALGYMPASDTSAFPEAEKQLQAMVDWIWRHTHEYFHWYGISWGGIQTHYQPKFGHWSDLTERFGWLNSEANTQAGVSMHYARTGNRRAFLLMRAMTRHDQDVATNQRDGMGRRHFVYAWGQGANWEHTMLMGPAIYYHLTGCERTRDVIEKTGASTRLAGTRGSTDRATHNVMRNALWMYEITGDEAWKKQAQAIMAETLKLQRADGLFEPGGTQSPDGLMTNIYLLWAMELYDRMIGDEEVRRSLVRLMDAQIAMPGRLSVGSYVHANAEGLAQAYRYSGRDKRFLWSGLRDLTTMRWNNLFERYDHILRYPRGRYLIPGAPGEQRDSFVGMHDVAANLIKMPYLLWAARDAGLTEAVFSKKIDTAQAGTYMPSAAQSRNVDWARYQVVKLAGANAAPLEVSPFGQKTGLSLAGLPWGASAVYGDVPFRLPPATDANDRAVICLRKGESVAIPVGLAAAKLHFLGNVLGNSGLEYGRSVGRYVIEYDDGSRQTVVWKNLVNCDDWRLEHYAIEAPVAQCWAPQAFSNDACDMNLVHVNTFAVDTGGKTVKQVVFEAGDSEALPILVALTVERVRPAVADRTALAVRFGLESSGQARVTPTESFHPADHCIESRGDVEQGRVTIALPWAGAYRVELVMDSTRPLVVDVRVGESRPVTNWQLLGEWPTGQCVQRTAFDVQVDGKELTFDIHARRGQCYMGARKWSLGWAYDADQDAWHVLRKEYLPAAGGDGPDPKADLWLPPQGFEAKYGPKWRIHEVILTPVDAACALPSAPAAEEPEQGGVLVTWEWPAKAGANASKE